MAKGRPFTKALVKTSTGEVLTREGITSPRETHCRFRSSSKVTGEQAGWAVKAACEELGNVSQETIAVAVRTPTVRSSSPATMFSVRR